MDTTMYVPPPPRKMEWRRAWNALRVLIKDPERTEQVFEIVRALSGGSWERSFQRFCAHPEGRRLLQERPSLLAALSDREALRSMPDGSFGRTYAEFMDGAQLDAKGLVEAEEAADKTMPKDVTDPDHEFFGDRLRDMHDLWHVLTGYGRDQAGEAANLAFSLGQIPQPGLTLIVLAAAVVGPKDLRLTWPRYLLQAWQRGRGALLLSAAPYEKLLALPLEDVRRMLGIQPAAEAHPLGIVVGDRTDQPADPDGNGGGRNNGTWELRRA